MHWLQFNLRSFLNTIDHTYQVTCISSHKFLSCNDKCVYVTFEHSSSFKQHFCVTDITCLFLSNKVKSNYLNAKEYFRLPFIWKLSGSTINPGVNVLASMELRMRLPSYDLIILFLGYSYKTSQVKRWVKLDAVCWRPKSTALRGLKEAYVLN